MKEYITSINNNRNNVIRSFAKPVNNNLEKGDISDQFANSQTLMISKSGKEIQEQTVKLLAVKTSQLEGLKAIKDAYIADCSCQPTESMYNWNSMGVDFDNYKRYPYWMCSYNDQTMVSSNTIVSGDCKPYEPEGYNEEKKAKNIEEAQGRVSYNDCVGRICAILTDIKCLETIQNNIKFTDIYKLTPSQLTVLGF